METNLTIGIDDAKDGDFTVKIIRTYEFKSLSEALQFVDEQTTPQEIEMS